jgi:sugar phosphate isomerase/epimerase
MIFLSSSSIKTNDIEDSLNSLINEGINNIELSGGTKYRANIEEVITQYQEKYDLNLLVHNYFPPPLEDFILNIACYDQAQRRKSVEFIIESIEFASRLGLDRYTVHAGYRRILSPPQKGDMFVACDNKIIDASKAMQYMYRSLDELEPTAKAAGIRIGIENLFPLPNQKNYSLLCTSEEIFAFLDATDGKSDIGILLDLGHLEISANYYNFDKEVFLDCLLNQYAHRILEVHLSGNDGQEDSHMMLQENEWQLQAARKIASALIGIPVTIECRGLTPKKAVQQYKMVSQIIEKGNLC